MKLTLTDDAGTVLDSLTITPKEFAFDVRNYPSSLLSQLTPGVEPETPARFLVVSTSSTMEALERYLYSSSTRVESWPLESHGTPTILAIVRVEGRDEADAAYLGEYQAMRLTSGLHTVWTSAATLADALAETVVVRATLQLV